MAEEHGCTQVGAIAKLKAKLESQGDADIRIEGNLKALSEEVKNNQKEVQEEFKKIATSLTTLNDSINTQNKAIEDLRSDVKTYTETLNKTQSRITVVEKDQKTNSDEITNLKTEHATITERIMKLEKWVAWITACGAVLFFVFQFFEHLDTVKRILLPELKQNNTYVAPQQHNTYVTTPETTIIEE